MPPAAPLIIRDYHSARDEAGVRACVVALQDHEHEFAPEAPTGPELVDGYVPFMLDNIAEHGGRLLVAERAGEILGFITAVVRHRDEPDDTDPFHVEINELSVLPAHRNGQVGERLVAEAEAYARDLEAPTVRIRVDARNGGARRFYQRLGYRDAVVTVKKSLRAEPPPRD